MSRYVKEDIIIENDFYWNDWQKEGKGEPNLPRFVINPACKATLPEGT